MLAHRSIVRVCLALCVLGMVAQPRSSSAGDGAGDGEGNSVAIVAMDVKGGAVAQIKSRTLESIAQKLEAEGISVIDHEEVAAALRKNKELVSCTTPDCLKQIGELVRSGRLLRLKVEASGATYTYEIELVLTAQGKSQRAQSSCPACTVSEAAEQIAESTFELLDKMTRESVGPGAVMVEIATTPAGARLQIDGNVAGVSPYRGELAPGSHTITASHPGYRDAVETALVVESSEPQRFSLALVKQDEETPAASRPFRMLKWAGVGLTAAALGTGVTWLVIDGKGTCPSGTCPELYDTRNQGLITVGVGALAGAATAWMFLRDRQDEQSMIVVAPTTGGAVAGLWLRF